MLDLYLRHAPKRLVRITATALASAKPLALEPGWHFDPGADDPSQLLQFRRQIWHYHLERRVDQPITFRWYDGLRVRMRLGTDMSLCLYAGGSFEPNEFVLLAQVLKPGMVFVDGGANEGLYSLFASKRVSPEGLVIAVEPSSRELERLKANIKLNRASNIRPRQAALGQGSGTAELAIAEAGHEGQNTVGQAVSNPTVATVGHEKVDLVTLDELVEREGLSRVDFVKLDVEGSEFDALRGATETLVRHRPLLQLEIEEERLASQNATKDEVLQLLETAGYSVYVFDGVTAQLRPPRRPDEPEGNAIAAPRDWSPPVLPATPRRR